MRSIQIVVFLILLTFRLNSTVKISAGSGDWTTSGVWSPSGQPACGDSVIILAAHTVSITSQINYSGCSSSLAIVVRGVLFFKGGSKLRLACSGRIYIMTGGAMDSDGSGGSNQLEQCGSTIWRGSDGRINGPSCLPPSLPGCANVLLPVELSHFTAFNCEAMVCLQWQTQSERDNDRFEIERSLDGLSFNYVKTVKSLAKKGNSIRTINYSETDHALAEDILYYRLKQVDADGAVDYSKIVAVYGDRIFISGFSVYPNPSEGIFTMRVNGINSVADVSYKVLDALGNIVLAGSQLLTPGAEDIKVGTTSRLSPGAYLISMNAGERNYRNKIVIQ